LNNDTPAPSEGRAHQHRLVYLLQRAHRHLDRWVRARHGSMTGVQAGALFVLGQHDGVLVGDMGKALGMAPSSATELADRLEAAGLIVRQSDQADGRGARLYLTEHGQSAREDAKIQTHKINAKLMEGFTTEELDTIVRWLMHIQTQFPKADHHD
jgi:DNA-binding MarR family transcriptional regulator